MKKHKFERREFVKSTSIGLGSLALSPLFTTANKTSQQNVETTSQKKLNICREQLSANLFAESQLSANH